MKVYTWTELEKEPCLLKLYKTCAETLECLYGEYLIDCIVDRVLVKANVDGRIVGESIKALELENVSSVYYMMVLDNSDVMMQNRQILLDTFSNVLDEVEGFVNNDGEELFYGSVLTLLNGVEGAGVHLIVFYFR